MQELDLYKLFIKPIDLNKIPYAVTGSVAAIIYGEPRMTHDIDIVIELNISNAEVLFNTFPSDEFYCPPIEILKTEILKTNRGHCNIIHLETGFKADIYFIGKDEFLKWAINNAKLIDYDNIKLAVAPPEYVIIKKLEFFREGNSPKHINDIKAIILNSKEIINFQILEKYISDFKFENEWKFCNE